VLERIAATTLAFAAMIGAPHGALGPSAQEPASPEVLREWAIRARALRSLGEHSPLLGAVPEPDGAFLGEGWRGRRSSLEALRRARRFVAVEAPAGAADGLASRPELAAVAIAASRADEAEDAIERGLASSFRAARAAAAERLARAIHETPELRRRAFAAPSGGRDLEAPEVVARARARAGLAGGAVPAWLAAEAVLGLDPGGALVARFDDLVRAPIDGRAVEDLRAAFAPGEPHWLAEVLAVIASLRDDAPVGGDLDLIRAGLLAEGLDFELASALYGAVDAAERTGRSGVGAPIGEIALELGRDGRAGMVEAAARLLPPARAVSAARTLPSAALRAAFIEEVDARDLWIDPAPFAAWLADDLAGEREDTEWLLELAARRYQYGGQPGFGALLATAVRAEDAWAPLHREATINRLADLTRAESSGEHAEVVAAAFRAAPPELHESVIARIYPGPGAARLGPEIVGWIDAVPARPAPRNTFEVAARIESGAVAAALLGALRRTVDVIAAPDADVDPEAALGAVAQQCGEALLANGAPEVDRDVVAAELARLYAAAPDAPPRCLVPLLELLGDSATSDLSALAPLLADGVDGDVRGRAAEAVSRGAARAARAGEEHDAGLARAASALIVTALEREAAAPGSQPIGRTTAMFRALAAAPPEHLARADLLRVIDAATASPRTPLVLLGLDLAVAHGEVGAVIAALEAASADPLSGERALAAARAALRGLEPAVRAAPDGALDAALAAERITALATLAPAEEDDGDYAIELLRGEAVAAAVRLLRVGRLPAAGDDAAALDAVARALFDASLQRAARATRARLEGREQAVVLSTPDPSVRGFEALGGRAGAQRSALLRAPSVLARLDARTLTELAEAASDPEVAAAFWVAADVAREGERPGRDADRREAKALVGLVRAAADAESDGALVLARGAITTLLGRMRGGQLPPRVLGLVLQGPIVGSGADALALVAAEAWRARTPQGDLEAALRAAFLRCEPAPR